MIPLVLVGLGSVLLLGWHKGRDVAEILGLSFGFALVVLPFVGYLRLPSLLVSVVFFASVLFYRLLPGRRVKVAWKKPEGWGCVLVVGLFSALMFFSLFKHPVFPAYLLMDPVSGATIPYVSVDPIVHIGFVRDILLGNYVPQQATTAYTSGHFLYASLVDRFDIIRSYRHVTLGLAALSPFLIYLVASKVSESKPTGVLASAMYVAGSPLWIHFTFSAGLMPNFLSLMLAMFTVWLLAEMKDWKPAYGIVAFLIGMVYWTSHFTAVLFFPALLVTLIFGKTSRRHVLCFLAPLLYVGWMLRSEIPALINLVVQGGRSPYHYTPNLTTRTLLDVHPFLFDWAVVAQGEPVFWLSLLGLVGVAWKFRGKVRFDVHLPKHLTFNRNHRRHHGGQRVITHNRRR